MAATATAISKTPVYQSVRVTCPLPVSKESPQCYPQILGQGPSLGPTVTSRLCCVPPMTQDPSSLAPLTFGGVARLGPLLRTVHVKQHPCFLSPILPVESPEHCDTQKCLRTSPSVFGEGGGTPGLTMEASRGKWEDEY